MTGNLDILKTPVIARDHSSMIATARVQPAEARSIFTGKQETVNPTDGNASRFPSFSRWL
jgi:hypothetical protein